MIGAGPAGSVAALVLARAGMAVTLVDASDRSAFCIGEGLPPAIRPVLASLDLQARFEAQGHRPALGNRSAWGSARVATTDFISHPFGNGWHLDRKAFEQTLIDAAREAGATMVRGSLRTVEGKAGAWRVTVGDDAASTAIEAEFVLDCSGRRAMFARRQGARRRRLDRLIAWAALLSSDVADADAMTLVEAVREGWWHTAQLPGAQRVAIFFTDHDLAGGRVARSSEFFRARLEETAHVGPLCVQQGYRVASVPWIAAADTARLDRFHGDGWIAAGDAAASFDPVSSQGILSAMQAGKRAAEAVLGRESFSGYAAMIDASVQRYLVQRAAVYAQERRWADAPFWMRRQHMPSDESAAARV